MSTRERAINIINMLSEEELKEIIELIIDYQRTSNPKNELLEAMEETEQIIDEYKNGTRQPKSYVNAREMFAAMDLEDEAEDEDE